MQSFEAIGVRLAHENSGITDVVVRDACGDEIMFTLEQMVEIANGGNEVYTKAGASRTRVYVISGPNRGTYLRTAPNKSIADNLLSLPTY